MTVALTHATAADGTFSTAGAAAWNAGHVLTGAANSVPFFGGAANALTDSSSLTYDDSTKRLTVGTGSGTSAGIQQGYAGASGQSGVWSTIDTVGVSTVRLGMTSGHTYIGAPSGGSVFLGNVGIAAGTKANTGAAAGEGFAITAGTATTDVAALSVTRTNNNAAVATGVKFAFTDTTSAAGFLPFQILGEASGTTNLLSIGKTGTVTLAASATLALSSGDLTVSPFILSTLGIRASTVAQLTTSTDSVRVGSGNVIGFSSSADVGAAGSDTGYSRGGAGIHAFGTGAAGSVAGQLHAGMLQASLGTALTLTQGAIGRSKMTASGSAPGATGAKFEVVAGTNAGTAKLIMYAGTSTTATTIIDNVGSGVS